MTDVELQNKTQKTRRCKRQVDCVVIPPPYYKDDYVTIYNADCLDILKSLAPNICVITDPPYPNNAGHFIEDVEAAKMFFAEYNTEQILTFWDEMETPPIKLPLVARHIWHRNNSNRPDNYEPIYEFNADGKKRASRVLPYPVVYPGLTGCVEATGHPTQKNLKLMKHLIKLSKAKMIVDPFMGSGTAVLAAKQLRCKAIGIERNIKWCKITADRLAQGILEL